ncbi:hypothetical protein V6N11_020946 [Hibiscus sabdariffa]|uniref:Uncharacterized protein n=1 Tax=Hibiscus sabdariffa TaxID=183260 RepID=A0ABR2Q9Z6_9ROSI
MGFYFYSACCLFIIFSKATTAIDTISPSESLSDGRTLISSDGSFALGFFSPGTSKNRYLGIWYNNIPIQNVVWVANRVNPVNDSTGLLKIETSGKIVLRVQNTTAVWSTNTTASVQNPVLQLLDSRNLVVRDGNDSNPENYYWQSFDYPSDTMLPGMKIGIDLRTGLHRILAAWKSWDDPSPGDLTYGVELEGNPEMVLRKGVEKYYRSGLWNGDGFSGSPNLRSNPIFDYDFAWNETEVYYIYFLKNKSVMSRFVLNQTESVRQRYTWNPETQTWKLFSIMPSDYCDRCGLCGPNGNCDNNKLPACQCLTRFKPKLLERWNSSDWSDGCIHSKPLNCQTGDGFIKIGKVKTPDTTNSWVNKTMNLKECRAKCLRNCYCMAYTNLDVTRGGSGCAMWFGDLDDIKQFESDGQDLYIRVSASEAEQKKRAKVKLGIILGTVIAALLGTFGGEQTHANTNRVVGTYGYMAPEYATDGIFSVKSDVFSFGIVLLEIISGRKNRGFYHANQSGNLIEHAWRLWEEAIPTEDKRNISLLVSSSLGHTSYFPPPPKIKLCTSQGVKGIDFQFLFLNNLKKKPGSELNKYGVVITPS